MDAYQDYRVLQDIYVLLDDGDRQLLQTFRLSVLQYNALLLLSEQEGWRLTDLSTRLMCERSTVTRLVDYLEGEGWLKRVADPDDRRSQRVLLTPAGASWRDRAREAHERSLRERFHGLTEDEQRQLSQLHQKLLAGLKRFQTNLLS